MGKLFKWIRAMKRLLTCTSKLNKIIATTSSTPPPDDSSKLPVSAVEAARAVEIISLLTNDKKLQQLQQEQQKQQQQQEELAAIKIQRAYRQAMAVKALNRHLRLRSLVEQNANQVQVLKTTKNYIKVQSELNKIKRARSMPTTSASLTSPSSPSSRAICLEDWDDSTLSAQQIEAKAQNKQDAFVRRHRTLAYATSQQLWRCYKTSAEENDNWSWQWQQKISPTTIPTNIEKRRLQVVTGFYADTSQPATPLQVTPRHKPNDNLLSAKKKKIRN